MWVVIVAGVVDLVTNMIDLLVAPHYMVSIRVLVSDGENAGLFLFVSVQTDHI